jgi:hypothetical protein
MHGPISFPDWKETLARADLSPDRREAFRREILSFLKHCKDTHSPATALLAKQYLEVRERLTRGPAREALRWFFRVGQSRALDAARPSPAKVEALEPEAAARDIRSSAEGWGDPV